MLPASPPPGSSLSDPVCPMVKRQVVGGWGRPVAVVAVVVMVVMSSGGSGGSGGSGSSGGSGRSGGSGGSE